MSKRRLVNHCLLGAVLALPATLFGIYSMGFAQEPPSLGLPVTAPEPSPLLLAQGDVPEISAGEMPPTIDLPGGAWPPTMKHDGKEQRISVGVQSCFTCHSAKRSSTAGSVDILGFGGLDGAEDDNWVLLNELVTWANQDKHHGSYVALYNKRSQKMAEVMGLVDEEGKSIIHRDVRCIACHSGAPIRQLEIDENAEWEGIVTAEMEKKGFLNRGVSCEGCHGEAGQSPETRELAGWDSAHTSKTSWRYLDPEIKSQKHGFFDIRSPIMRTKMCLSCHLGNVEEGRVVTHEMMAAGHPPLPGFELETFSLQEPLHWRNFHEKSPEIQKEFLAATEKKEGNAKGWRTTDYREDDLHNTRDLLIGSVINLSELIRLSLNMADPKTSVAIGSDKWTRGTEEEWPEFSLFACYACHNDLQAEGWRLQREPIGTPGRPPLHEWPFALARFALKNTGDGNNDLLAQVDKVQLAAVDGPFGNKAVLMKEGRKLISMLESYATTLEKMPLPKSEANRLLNGLVEMAEADPPNLDYDSARQLVWAFRTIYEDAKGLSPDGEELYSSEALEKRPGWYDSNNQSLTKVQKGLAEFSELMLMDLRKGSRQDDEIKKRTGLTRPFLQWDANLALPKVGAYTPKAFAAKLRKLHSMVSNDELTKTE